MIRVRRLSADDHSAVCSLIKSVESTLENQSWFISMPQSVMDHMFDAGTTLTIYGAEVDGNLAAIALLDTDESEMADLVSTMGISPSKKGAELGVCMVLPAYRGKHLMYLVSLELIKAAKEMQLDYLVASAHADNLASCRSLEKLGMRCMASLTRHGEYIRNAYYLPL